MRLQLDALGASLDEGDAQAVEGLRSATVYLDAGQEAVRRRNLQRGWKKVHRARECLVECMDGHSLRLEADDLLRRAEALGWEKEQQIRRWLTGGFDALGLAERRRTVRRALLVHNDHWDVHYQSVRLTESRLRTLSGILMVATAGAILLATLGAYRLVPDVEGGTFAGVVVLLGVLGGVVSALVSTLTGSGDRMLPHTIVDGSWNLLRASFGGASALLVVLALGGGLLGVTVGSQQAYYVWAAVAGFSEGLFLRIAVSLAGRLGSGRERRPEERVIDA